MKTGTIKLLQAICLCVVLVCVLGLGIEIYRGHTDNLTAVYWFGGLGIVGFLANAALAVWRVCLELKK